MKPRSRSFLRAAFPSLIILPAMAQMAAAALIVPDINGDVFITTLQSGNNNVVATDPQPAGQHLVRFDAGTSLTPAGATAVSILVEQAAGASYFIDNNVGATITGDAGFDGISTTGAATPSDLSVQSKGAISGGNNGISTIGLLELVNGLSGTIVGNLGTGVTALGDFSSIENHGRIKGQTAAILLGNNAFVVNKDSGDILGNIGDGITTGNNVNITNDNATIVGLGGNGITALDNAEVRNQTGASIYGNVNGVSVGNTLNLFNQGIITGLTATGVTAGNISTIQNFKGALIEGGTTALQVSGASIVTNDGEINGAVTGINFLAGTGGILNNTDNITGGTNAILGSAGDETYNLNLGSRIRGDVNGVGGVDAINFGASLSSAGGVDNSISGNITNINSITRLANTGGGVALIGLPGEGPFTVNTPTITVNGGGLYINGNINAGLAPADFISNGIAIGGTGTWNANVTINTGGISAGSIPINLDVLPSNSVGQVNIVGIVDHTPTSFVRFDVNPNITLNNGVNSDQIVHTGGSYKLDGANVRIAATDNNSIIRNGTYTIVDSNTLITGGFGNLSSQLNRNVNGADTGIVGSEIRDFDADFGAVAGAGNSSKTILAQNFSTLSFEDGGTNLVVTINHDFSRLATNSNAFNFGNALDQAALTNTLNAQEQDLIAALDNSDLATVQSVLAGANGDSTFGITSAIVSGNSRLHTLVRDHNAMLRASGDSLKSYVGSYSTTVPGSAPAPMMHNSHAGNVWGTFSYDKRDTDDFGSGDINGETYAFTAGFDYRVSQDLVVGVLLDGAKGDYDYSGGSTDVDSYRAALYGTYGKSTGIYADFLAGYGNHDIELDRNNVLLGSLNSDTNAESFQAMITIGYTMEAGKFRHGPFGSVEYQNIDVDGYTQGGGGLFPIGVSGYDQDSFRLLGGYRVEADCGRFTPYASVAYAHEFKDDSFGTTATLPGGGAFNVSGGGLESGIVISAGTGFAITESLGLNVGYRGDIAVGGDGTDSHGGSIGLNYSF